MSAAAPLCGRLDDEVADRVFFGRPNTGRHSEDDVEFARHLCAACPLREGCLDEALATPELYDRFGIRAGLLPDERKALRVEMRVRVKSTGEWIGGRANRHPVV